jgi:hypothetical protein
VSRWLIAALAWGLASAPASAADLSDAAIRAYDEFFAAARRSFVARAAAGAAPQADGDTTRAGRGTARPGTGDGILSKPDSLVHHWRGGIFLPGVTLDQVIAVSQRYADYPRIFKPIRAAAVLPPTGSALHVRFRMQSSAGGLSATLDVRTRIEWTRLDERRAYVVSASEEIREVVDAGTPDERLLPEGRDSGYLWRAASMTRFVAGSGGVWMEMETVGLSRRFPPLVGWVLEPIARRLGRGSVEDSMQEFALAVRDRSKLAP